MVECGTRALLDVVLGRYDQGENSLARSLVGSLGPGMLLLADRGFPSKPLWKTFTEAGRLFKGTKSSGAGSSGNRLAAPGSSGSSTYTPVPYGIAYKRLWTQYGTQLTQQYGFKRPAVDTMIRRALAHAGYKRPPTQAQQQAMDAPILKYLPAYSHTYEPNPPAYGT